MTGRRGVDGCVAGTEWNGKSAPRAIEAPGPEASGLEGVARLSAADDFQSNLCAIREIVGRGERAPARTTGISGNAPKSGVRAPRRDGVCTRLVRAVDPTILSDGPASGPIVLESRAGGVRDCRAGDGLQYVVDPRGFSHRETPTLALTSEQRIRPIGAHEASLSVVGAAE